MTQSLERRAFSLGTANAIDYGLQFVLPIVLTRALDAHGFGQYRLLFLAAGTLMAVAPLFMPQSLYYFLPRSDPRTKRLYINQTLVFMTMMACLAAWAVSEWNPLRPGPLNALGDTGVLVPAFVLAWIVASLLDVLPTVDERVRWQARAIVALSVTRSVMLAGIALLTHDFAAVLLGLVAFAVLKLAVLVYYIATTHGIGGPILKPAALVGQVKHAAPFGIAGTLYGLRMQADQWVAAVLFPVTLFASFSIAAVLGPLVNLFRQSVNHVFLPSMSRLHASGDLKATIAMNSRANAMVAMLVYPLLAFAFVFAEPLITFVYTKTYIDAAMVLRVYIVVLIAFVIYLNSLLLLLKQGPFSARVNAAALVLSVPLSYWGATHLGLAGAALGSVAMLNAERVISLRRIARLTGEPLSRLQDWTRLGAVIAASIVAASLSGLLAHAWSVSPFLMLAIGGACMAFTYPALLVATGQLRPSTALGLLHASRAKV